MPSSYPKPVASLPAADVFALETVPLVKPTGFREYDARWWFGVPGSTAPRELNLPGVTALGMGIGTLLGEMGVPRDIVTGHDFRSYSASIKMALVAGLVASGCRVRDIGLAVTPMAYYAQFALDVPAVAMVTASHNENGWTGVKMGAERPLTFGPDEMTPPEGDRPCPPPSISSPAAAMNSSPVSPSATSPCCPTGRSGRAP